MCTFFSHRQAVMELTHARCTSRLWWSPANVTVFVMSRPSYLVLGSRMLKNNQHRALHRAVVATTMLIFLVGFGCTTAEPVREPVVVPSQEPDTRFEGSYPAPPFPAGAVWLNTNVPPTVDRVAGRLVIIDFWTSGCINCIHMIPVLKQLQAEFREEIAVIGVHSGKFVTEGRTDSIRATLNRYGIDHPVMNDADFRAWSRFQIGAWPTLVFVDPRGRVIGTQAGEVPAPTLRAFVDELITYWDLQYPGELDRSPLPWEGTPGIG